MSLIKKATEMIEGGLERAEEQVKGIEEDERGVSQ